MSVVNVENSPRENFCVATNPIIAALSVQSAGPAIASSNACSSHTARNFSRSRELQLTPPLTAIKFLLRAVAAATVL